MKLVSFAFRLLFTHPLDENNKICLDLFVLAVTSLNLPSSLESSSFFFVVFLQRARLTTTTPLFLAFSLPFKIRIFFYLFLS